MTIENLQEQVDHWIKTYGVKYFGEMSNMLILMEEVGELSRLMVRHYGEQSFKPNHQPKDIQQAISEEIADILFVLTCLSNQMGIDLTKSIEDSFIKKTNRDKERHLSNDKLK